MGGATVNSNWYYRILALFLALVSWYLVTGRERVETWVKVRIEVAGLAEGLVLLGNPRDSIDVLVRGPKGLVRKIEPGSLVYTLDARKLVAGVNTIVVEPGAIPLSKLFEVAEVRPSKLELDVDRRQSKTVPVRVVFQDASGRDYKLSAALEPAQVTISGPESVLKNIKDVTVQPLTLPDDVAGRMDVMASLVVPDQVDASPRMVKAHVQYQMNMRDVALDVPLRLAYQGKAQVAGVPDMVVIKFKAPVMLLREGAWRGLVDAFVEVDPALQPGRHETTYRVTLPQGCELISARPEKVTIVVK